MKTGIQCKKSFTAASFLVGSGNLPAKPDVHFFVVFSSHYTSEKKCSSYYLSLYLHLNGRCEHSYIA